MSRWPWITTVGAFSWPADAGSGREDGADVVGPEAAVGEGAPEGRGEGAGAGDFDERRALHLVQKHYGGIGGGRPRTRAALPAEPAQRGELARGGCRAGREPRLLRVGDHQRVEGRDDRRPRQRVAGLLANPTETDHRAIRARCCKQ